MVIIPIATPALADPNTLPTTVGIVEKNPPFAAPLIITNTARGARLIETGHIVSMLTAPRHREMNSVLRGPSASLARPKNKRPAAEARLKPATRAAPVLEERCRDVL